MNLSEISTGKSAIVVKVLGSGNFRRRIIEMGFVRGKKVEVLLNAPLNDPIKYKIMDYEVSLRRSEAALIEVISEEASRMLAEMLEGVVSEGSGKKAYIEGYKVGGKTGTAQKYEDGRIAAGKYVSSFIGFFPSDDPQYLALITVDEPQGTYYGSAVAAPAAKAVFEDIIAIKNIQPVQVWPRQHRLQRLFEKH